MCDVQDYGVGAFLLQCRPADASNLNNSIIFATHGLFRSHRLTNRDPSFSYQSIQRANTGTMFQSVEVVLKP